MLISLDIPPGIYRNGTDFQSQGRWFDADLMRFHEGTIRPVGGWSARNTGDAVTGSARAVLPWSTNDSVTWTGVGTHSGLWVLSRSGGASDITPTGFFAGNADARIGGGYGEGLYGAGTYGTERPSTSSIIPASVWSLDTWGEYLVGTMDGVIYEWRLDTSVPAAAIANAPQASSILVTDERIMMALGADGDPKAVDWSDAENNTVWTPTSTNLAGGRRLQTSGGLRCGLKVRGAYLLLTDVDVHRVTYDGLPLVYRFDRLATGCGVVSKGGAVSVNDEAYWMGSNNFWAYRGGVDPLPCDVADYVFSDINRTQISKVTCEHNSLFGEVWWRYPSADSDEVDRYVSFNYREGHWNIGEMDRLCGYDSGVTQFPQAVSSAGLVYFHETGAEKDDRQPFLTSGAVEIGKGDRTMEVHAIIPDESNLGDVAVSFFTADYPMSAATTVASVSSVDKTDVRFSGRRVSVKLTGVAEEDFRIGAFRFDAKAGSGR